MTLKDPPGFHFPNDRECPFKRVREGPLPSRGVLTFVFVALIALYLVCGTMKVHIIMYCLYNLRQCWKKTSREEKPKLTIKCCTYAFIFWCIAYTPYAMTTIYAFLFLYILRHLVLSQSDANNFREPHSNPAEALAKAVDTYSTNRNALLLRQVCQKSSCLFAKRARVMASVDWDDGISFAENITKNVRPFKIFLQAIESMGMDGFAFKVPNRYAKNERQLGESVLRIFRALIAHDPSSHDCLDNNFVHKEGWTFSFDFEPFFVTTFATFYPIEHSRYCQEGTFVLFQPERSFYEKKLPADHGIHDTIQTIRDRIRHNFAKHGQPYYVPASPIYPASHHIVKPMKDTEEMYSGDAPGVVKWWALPDAKSTDHSDDRLK